MLQPAPILNSKEIQIILVLQSLLQEMAVLKVQSETLDKIICENNLRNKNNA